MLSYTSQWANPVYDLIPNAQSLNHNELLLEAKAQSRSKALAGKNGNCVDFRQQFFNVTRRKFHFPLRVTVGQSRMTDWKFRAAGITPANVLLCSWPSEC